MAPNGREYPLVDIDQYDRYLGTLVILGPHRQ